MKVIKITKNEELFNKVLSYEVKWAEATSNKMANKALEAFAFTKEHDLIRTFLPTGEGGIGWYVDGQPVLLTIPNTENERHFYEKNDINFIDEIRQRKMIVLEMEVKKEMKKAEEKKVESPSVDVLLTTINNLRTRNSELVSKVGKMKNEIKSANDEIASLKKMLEMATLKIAELEDANEELSIYKELVEEDTKIEE